MRTMLTLLDGGPSLSGISTAAELLWHSRQYWLALAMMVLGGCVMVPRRPPPPDLINTAVPAGFKPDIRMLSVNRQRYMQELPGLAAGLRQAAHGRPINVLALSGGGSYGAFGAGALVGLSRAHARPKFQLVTGVSAGALLAPFAFLGTAWDTQLQQVFTSGALASLQHSGSMPSVLKRVVFPQGVGGHDVLASLVDRFISNALIDAVARQAKTGRQLWIATTDLDDQETMFWNMTAVPASPLQYPDWQPRRSPAQSRLNKSGRWLATVAGVRCQPKRRQGSSRACNR